MKIATKPNIGKRRAPRLGAIRPMGEEPRISTRGRQERPVDKSPPPNKLAIAGTCDPGVRTANRTQGWKPTRQSRERDDGIEPKGCLRKSFAIGVKEVNSPEAEVVRPLVERYCKPNPRLNRRPRPRTKPSQKQNTPAPFPTSTGGLAPFHGRSRHERARSSRAKQAIRDDERKSKVRGQSVLTNVGLACQPLFHMHPRRPADRPGRTGRRNARARSRGSSPHPKKQEWNGKGQTDNPSPKDDECIQAKKYS